VDLQHRSLAFYQQIDADKQRVEDRFRRAHESGVATRQVCVEVAASRMRLTSVSRSIHSLWTISASSWLRAELCLSVWSICAS
jgi:hypothetical protein